MKHRGCGWHIVLGLLLLSACSSVLHRSGQSANMLAYSSSGELELFHEQRLTADPALVNSLDFDSVGKRIAIAGQDDLPASRMNQIYVMSLKPGRSRLILPGHADAVSAVRFTPDGQHLLSCGLDHRLMLWSLESGTALQTWNYSENTPGAEPGDCVDLWFMDVETSFDGSVIVSVHASGHVLLWSSSSQVPVGMGDVHEPIGYASRWELKPGARIALLTESGAVYWVDFSIADSSDATHHLVTSAGNLRLALTQTTNQLPGAGLDAVHQAERSLAALHHLTRSLEMHNRRGSISPDGGLLIGSEERRVSGGPAWTIVRNVNQAEVLRVAIKGRWSPHTLSEVAMISRFLPDNRRFFTVTVNGAIDLWRLEPVPKK